MNIHLLTKNNHINISYFLSQDKGSRLSLSLRGILARCLSLFALYFVVGISLAQAATLNVSGMLYSDTGATPITASKTIKLVVATTTTSVFSTTTDDGIGSWSVVIPDGHTIATGTRITVFVDGDAVKASVVTKASGTGNITGLDLYAGHVIVRNEATGTTTRATDLFDYDSSDDTDIQFTGSSSIERFTVVDTETLYVASGTTFKLDAPVTTGSFKTATTATALASSTLTLSGDFTQRGMYLSGASSTALFATTTPGDANYFESVAYGEGLFVAVSPYAAVDSIITSTDGLNWSAHQGFDQLADVTYGNGRFVAVCGFDSPCDYVAYSDDGTSWATTSAAVSGLWGGLAYGNSLFVAVPIYDDTYTATTSLMTSSDGITWTKRTGVEANQWEAVTYGNGLYVAVANNGTNRVMTSSDGVTWTAHSAAGDDDAWTSVAYGNGLYVAVGAGDNAGGGDTFMTSPDGINWTTRLAPHPTIWNGISITYGNGLFVATARTNNIIMTSPDGVNWTVRLDSTNLGAFAGADVVFGNGLIVGVSYDTSMSFPADFPIVLSGTSTQDLSGNLTGASALPALIMKDAGTKTFLVNASTTDITIATSSGNVTAPAAISISGSLTNGSTFIGDEVMYVGSNLTNTGTTTAPTDLYVTGNLANTNILASSDNIYLTGNLTNSGTLTTSNNVYLGGNFDNSGTFTAPTNFYFNGNNQTATGTMTGISALNNVTLSSISSSTKTFTTNASTSNLTIISGTAFSAPGEISVSGDYNNNGTSSYVGAPWTARNAVGNDDNWYSVTYGNGLFVAVGEGSGGDYVMTSPDGATWTGRTAVVTNLIWRSVTYGNGLFVAVPYSDLSNAPTTTLMTSPDGITWTARTASEASYWRAITYGNGLFVVVAGGGTNRVMTSPDGSNWTSRSAAGDDDQWTGVTYGNGLFVAVGETNGVNDAVMTSPDGINWTVRSAADNNDYWFSITYAKDLFVAVGQPQGAMLLLLLLMVLRGLLALLPIIMITGQE